MRILHFDGHPVLTHSDHNFNKTFIAAVVACHVRTNRCNVLQVVSELLVNSTESLAV